MCAFAVPIGKPKNSDETPIYRNNEFVDKLSELPEDEPDTLYELIQYAFENYKDQPYLGHRVKDSKTNQLVNEYKWLTFGQIQEKVEKVANGLWHLITENHLAQPEKQSTIAFYAPNSSEIWTSDLACTYHRLISVGIFDTFGPDTAIHVLNNCEATILFTHTHKLPFILTHYAKFKYLKVLICVDTLPSNGPENSYGTIFRQWANATDKLLLLSFDELLKLGSNHKYPHHKPDQNDIATLCYTSGTSGTPKGAIQTHNNYIISSYSTSQYFKSLDSGVITISYLPLAHVYERFVQYQLIWCGGQTGFYSGDITRLLEDVQLIKPTIFTSVPRVLNRIKDTIIQTYSKGDEDRDSLLFKLGMEAKLHQLKEDGITVHEDWDRLIFNKVSQILGGKIEIILTGTAPLSLQTKDFLKVTFSCFLVEGYGSTETSSNITANAAGTNTEGHVGPPNGCNEIKLRSVPEMKYLVTDKPHPRGEILVRGANIFKGYYNEPEKTKEVIDEDGFYKTGDIGYIDDEGLLYIIDRKSSVFKLSQGEYVTPERVELVLQKHPVVQTCWVAGRGTENYPVVVIVPNSEIFKSWYLNHFDGTIEDSELSQLYQDNQVIENLCNELKELCTESKLAGFETPRRIYLESTPFSLENQLITPTQKLCRPKLQNHYKSVIDKLYELKN